MLSGKDNFLTGTARSTINEPLPYAYIFKEAPPHSAGPGQGLGLGGPGARVPARALGSLFWWILGWSGVHFGRFCFLLEGLGDPKAALEVPEPAGRGQEGAGSAQGRLRVGWGVDFGPNLGPTWPQLGSKN